MKKIIKLNGIVNLNRNLSNNNEQDPVAFMLKRVAGGAINLGEMNPEWGARPDCNCHKYSDGSNADGSNCSYWRCLCSNGAQYAVNNCNGWHIGAWNA